MNIFHITRRMQGAYQSGLYPGIICALRREEKLTSDQYLNDLRNVKTDRGKAAYREAHTLDLLSR